MTQLTIQGSSYTLAEETDLDALKAEFLAAVSKARFVTFWTDAGERVDALVNAFTSLTIAERDSPVHHPDVSADLNDSDLDLFYDFS